MRPSSVASALSICMYRVRTIYFSIFFFFNDTATTEIYTLSLHDALPISFDFRWRRDSPGESARGQQNKITDRKSTRLNSSHTVISYAVFCLKKKTESPATSGRFNPSIAAIGTHEMTVERRSFVTSLVGRL